MERDLTEITSDSKYIVYLVKQWWGVAWYRARVPGTALNGLGYDVKMTDQLDRNWIEQCDVFVTTPTANPQTLELVRHLKGRGALTVLDTDDDYWTLHPENPASWSAENLATYANIGREVDRITVATPELVDVMKPLNDRVYVLPNALPEAVWPAEPKEVKGEGEPLVLGWAGSTGHAPDLRMMYHILLQLLDEFPTLEVRIAGLNTDQMPTHPRLIRPEPVKIEQYPDLLAGFDIGIAPLIDSRFNRCKSDLKFLEYGMVGLPVVASNVTPYSRSIKNGENGYLAKNAKGWLKYLRLLITDYETRARIAAEARAFAETRLITDNVDRWVKAYGLDKD